MAAADRIFFLDTHNIVTPYIRWIHARLQWLQRASNGVTADLHWAIDLILKLNLPTADSNSATLLFCQWSHWLSISSIAINSLCRRLTSRTHGNSVNSLWPDDAMPHHRSASTLDQEMMSPTHYLIELVQADKGVLQNFKFGNL